MSIKTAIFTVESIAHLQGKEALLLPVVDAARTEHEALIARVSQLESVLRSWAAHETAYGDPARIPDAAKVALA